MTDTGTGVADIGSRQEVEVTLEKLLELPEGWTVRAVVLPG